MSLFPVEPTQGIVHCADKIGCGGFGQLDRSETVAGDDEGDAALVAQHPVGDERGLVVEKRLDWAARSSTPLRWPGARAANWPPWAVMASSAAWCSCSAAASCASRSATRSASGGSRLRAWARASCAAWRAGVGFLLGRQQAGRGVVGELDIAGGQRVEEGAAVARAHW